MQVILYKSGPGHQLKPQRQLERGAAILTEPSQDLWLLHSGLQA